MNIANSIIKRQSVGPIFKTESITLFIPWIHLQHVSLILHGNSTLTFYFSTHTVTLNASPEILEYALSLCGRGEAAEFIFSSDVKIAIEEKMSLSTEK